MINENNQEFWEDIYNKNIFLKYTNNIDYENFKLIWNYPNWYPINSEINNTSMLKKNLLEFKEKYKKYFIKIIVDLNENNTKKKEYWLNFPFKFIKNKKLLNKLD